MVRFVFLFKIPCSSVLHLAAYQVGLTFITEAMRRALNSCVSPEKFFSKGRMGVMDANIQVPIGLPDEEVFDPIDLALEAIMGV
jgi:hypothetical protein